MTTLSDAVAQDSDGADKLPFLSAVLITDGFNMELFDNIEPLLMELGEVGRLALQYFNIGDPRIFDNVYAEIRSRALQAQDEQDQEDFDRAVRNAGGLDVYRQREMKKLRELFGIERESLPSLAFFLASPYRSVGVVPIDVRILADPQTKRAFGQLLCRELTQQKLMPLIDDRVGLREHLERLSMAVNRLLSENEEESSDKNKPSAREKNIFRKNGEYWTLRYNGTEVHVRDLKGLRYIDWLLTNPGRELPARELFQLAHQMGTPIIRPGDRHVPDDLPQADPILDEQAKHEFGKRVKDLVEELREAEELSDLGRAQRLRDEIEIIEEQLNAAQGLAGRDRKLGDVGERMRKSVANRIKHAIEKIEEKHPALGKHLSASIRTGTVCSYNPDTDHLWH